MLESKQCSGQNAPHELELVTALCQSSGLLAGNNGSVSGSNWVGDQSVLLGAAVAMDH